MAAGVGGGVKVAGAAAVDAFLPPLPPEGPGAATTAFVPNGGVGASLGPAVVAAQARTVAEARRKEQRGGGWW